ncbi:hypothetical protein MBLNU457_6612t1 [Dothideomycetes sp. NU457]
MNDFYYQQGFGSVHGQDQGQGWAQPRYHDPRQAQGRPPPRRQDPRQPPYQPQYQPQHQPRQPHQYPSQDRQRGNMHGRLPPQQRPPPLQAPRPGQQTRGPPSQQSSQWPLVNDYDYNSVQPQQQRRPAPQRPPRPSQVPIVLPPPQQRNTRARGEPPVNPQYWDPSPREQTQMPLPPPGVFTEDGYGSPARSPASARPLTGGSTTSSAYSFSDDLPAMPAQPPVAAQPRARPPLGPPPSARRGPSSYYPQQQGMAFVAPIVEESDSQRGSLENKAGSRSSYASSNAIPIGVPDHYLTEFGAPPTFNNRYTASDYDSSSEHLPMQPPSAVISPPRDESPPGLVRQASLGKRSKPTLTTIKSSENFRSSHLRNETHGSNFADDDQVDNNENARRRVSSGIFGKELDSGDRSSSESDRSVSTDILRAKEYGRSPSPESLRAAAHHDRNSPVSPIDESIRDTSEKAGGSHIVTQSQDQSSLAQRVGARRPPRINVDAIKEAEQRGSLTSLTDLIRRATKVASNLDRGRTASRLGFDWMDDEKRDRSAAVAAANAAENRRSASLSDMLSSFPHATPGENGRFHWPCPNHTRHSALPSDIDENERRKQKKRVCGMRRCTFVVLILLLLILIAAAVLVPVFLLVLIPRWNSPADQLATCQKSTTCSNGGINIVGSGGDCECLCVNGFTGATCQTEPDAGCTTTTIDGNDNVTVGDALPRLFSGAASNYSVPLNGQAVLGLFSSSNLSCASQNSLVSFGSEAKRSVEIDLNFDSVVPAVLLKQSPTKTLNKRQSSSTTSSGSTVTSNGIIFQTGGSTNGSSPSMPSSPFSNNTQTLDFARIAVLFVLQDSRQLNDAVSAQKALQSYFSTGTDSSGKTLNASNVPLQNGYSADLVQYTLTAPNGTTVG